MPTLAPANILNARILIVDDLAANILLLEGMLRIAGYTAVESTTRPAAVYDLHLKNRYDLILLDFQMPEMNGLQVMERLHEIETDSYLPVIVITAQPDQKLPALRAGAKDFVNKPFDLAELAARVHNVLEVRLLHREAKDYARKLEETVRELEASREVIRLKDLAERRQSEAEFVLAQKTQESLLPRSLPMYENFNVCAFNNPTRYVGGDFYDFRRINSLEWAGVLADVSGKGMFAALLSSMVLGALNMEFRSGARPHEVLERVNRLVCEKSLPSQFVTLALFTLRPDGSGTFVSAGHNPSYLFRAGTGQVEELASESCFLGMFDSLTFPSRELHLEKGDILIVYSDGVTDAQNPLDEMFGIERLLGIIRQEGPNGSRTLEREILRAIEDFTHGAPQTDDVTLVVVEKAE